MKSVQFGDEDTIPSRGEQLLLTLVAGLETEAEGTDIDRRGVASAKSVARRFPARLLRGRQVIEERLENAVFDDVLAECRDTLAVKGGLGGITFPHGVVGDRHAIGGNLFTLLARKAGQAPSARSSRRIRRRRLQAGRAWIRRRIRYCTFRIPRCRHRIFP